jgi:hypothetical protein
VCVRSFVRSFVLEALQQTTDKLIRPREFCDYRTQTNIAFLVSVLELHTRYARLRFTCFGWDSVIRPILWLW